MERNLNYDEVHERIKPHLDELVNRLSGDGNGSGREDPWAVVSDFSKRINYPIGYLELLSHLDIYLRESRSRVNPQGPDFSHLNVHLRESRPRLGSGGEDLAYLAKQIKEDGRLLERSSPNLDGCQDHPDLYE